MTKKQQQDKLLAVSMDLIGPNPHRDLTRYPPEPDRVKAIRESIADVGWFPGNIVVRMAPPGAPYPYQQAYGHRRLQAAREHFTNPKERLLVVVRELSDEDMLKYMVRENIADNTGRDFLMLLETWEATLRFLSSNRKPASTVDVAIFMGWDRPTKSNGRMLLTNAAYGCNAAHELIERTILDRDVFTGLTLAQAIKFARETHGKLRAIESKARALPAAAVARELDALRSDISLAITRIRQANEAKADGAEAALAFRIAARGPARIPDAGRAIAQTRETVQSWDLSDRVNAFCEVASDLNKHEREQLTWLRKDLAAAVMRLGLSLSLIEDALRDSSDGAVDTIARDVRFLSQETSHG